MPMGGARDDSSCNSDVELHNSENKIMEYVCVAVDVLSVNGEFNHASARNMRIGVFDLDPSS